MSEASSRCAYMPGACRSVSSCMHTGKCIRQAEANVPWNIGDDLNIQTPPIEVRRIAEKETRLITHKQVIGQFAIWAIRQHPYGRPEGLFDLCDVLTEKSAAWPDGVASLHMWEVAGSREIELWLRDALNDHPVLSAWNTPRSGHAQQFVTVSRYGGPQPEHDFIDIDALLGNVARSVWHGESP